MTDEERRRLTAIAMEMLNVACNEWQKLGILLSKAANIAVIEGGMTMEKLTECTLSCYATLREEG